MFCLSPSGAVFTSFFSSGNRLRALVLFLRLELAPFGSDSLYEV